MKDNIITGSAGSTGSTIRYPGVYGGFTDLNNTAPVLAGAAFLQLPVQTHTANVALATGNPADEFPATDGLVSFDPGVAVGVRTADCVPVLLYAPDIRGVAAVHAGWRGTISGITLNAIGMLIDSGAAPDRMVAWFGPSICGACYEVDNTLGRRFADAGFSRSVRFMPGGKAMLDLQSVNIGQMLRAGLTSGNINPCGICTFTDRRYPSWRRHPGESARIITYIGLLP